MADPTLTPRAPFSGMAAASDAGGGVIAADRDGLGIATVAARKGAGLALTQRVRERFGIELPSGPYRRAADGTAFAGTGPEIWLATQERGGNEFAAALKAELGGMASIADQSDGYAVLRLTGKRLRDVLGKILPIDVHARAFEPGDVAATVAAHIGATLWRLEDGADGAPIFEIAVFRSLAGSFWHALSESAAEYGLRVSA